MYPHKDVEAKWQEFWEKNQVYKSDDFSEAEKRYVLDMFPYPSGDGLHVGHPMAYIGTDILSRYFRANGYNVLHPMGWDAFGLPAENYAIKKGIHPEETTEKNTARFREQLKSIGLSYDWSREINTSKPEYYRWNQWLFLELFKKGLAYKKNAPVNWCENDHTVLANEQVVNDKCERCGNLVVQKELEQWFFKVTAYADELLADLETLDWPEPIKAAQRNWIGKSEGALIDFKLTDHPHTVQVFTTRPDTLFGVTYIVLAPEHELIERLKVICENAEEVTTYIESIAHKTERERMQDADKKTGVLLKGITATNPANGEAVPVWIADYVLASYGTGAVMAVPAHDERDNAFAKAHDLAIKTVITTTDGEATELHTGTGTLTNSAQFDGIESTVAKKLITEFVHGTTTTQYRLRDWLISRQRYWGTPIPIVYCDEHGTQAVPEIDLPVLLPRDVNFLPTGESPLVNSKEFHDVKCPQCEKPARREYDTMDGFVCSSWYFLRFASPRDNDCPFTKEAVDYWLPVDYYVGGAEHAVLHLLYARFITKALRDMGYLTFSEPFTSLRNQGLIMGEDGEKMSKSRGNVINPDEVIGIYGADTLRLYEMFMGPFEDAKPWSTQGMVGVRRFLDRIWRTYHEAVGYMAENEAFRVELPADAPVNRELAKTTKKITEDIKNFHFNTCVSTLMIMANFLHDMVTNRTPISKAALESYLVILAPFAPHLAEELNELLGNHDSITLHAWPHWDESLIQESTYKLTIQVDNKVRDHVEFPLNATKEEIEATVLDREAVRKWTQGKMVADTILIPRRVINIITK